jgi:hypothetical protein
MQIRLTTVSAQCPHCRSELPLGADQAAWLGGGQTFLVVLSGVQPDSHRRTED